MISRCHAKQMSDTANWSCLTESEITLFFWFLLIWQPHIYTWCRAPWGCGHQQTFFMG